MKNLTKIQMAMALSFIASLVQKSNDPKNTEISGRLRGQCIGVLTALNLMSEIDWATFIHLRMLVENGDNEALETECELMCGKTYTNIQ